MGGGLVDPRARPVYDDGGALAGSHRVAGANVRNMEARHTTLSVAAPIFLLTSLLLGFGSGIDAILAAVDPDGETGEAVVQVATPEGHISPILAASPTLPSLLVKGSIIAHETSTDVVGRVQIPLALATDESVDLASASLLVTYIDANQSLDLAFNATANLAGSGNAGWMTNFTKGSGAVMDPGERADFWVNLEGLGTLLGTNDQFTLQIKPEVGSVLEVTRTTPREITTITNLGYDPTGPPALLNPSSVLAHEWSTFDVIGRIQIPIVTATGTPVDLSSTSLVVTYIDANQVLDLTQNTSAESAGNNAGWDTVFGAGDSGPLLDPGEQADFWVNLRGLVTLLGTYDEFIIQIKPNVGGILQIRRTTPGQITTINDLGDEVTTQPTLLVKGSVIAHESSTSNVIGRVQIPVAVPFGTSVDVSAVSLVVTYVDANQTTSLAFNVFANFPGSANAGWMTNFSKGTGAVLHTGERADFWVNLSGLTTPLGPSTQFTIQIKPADVGLVNVQRITPAAITAITNLGSGPSGPPALSNPSSVLAHKSSTDNVVERIQIPVVTATGTPVDLSSASLIVTYIDANQIVDISQNTSAETAGNNSGWDTVFGVGDSGPLLDPGEQADIWVNLSFLATLLGPSTQFTIQIKPFLGSILEIQRTTPAQITTITNLGANPAAKPIPSLGQWGLAAMVSIMAVILAWRARLAHRRPIREQR